MKQANIEDTGGTITNIASVDANETDLNNANNTATASTTVTPVADLSLTKSDSPDPILGGNTLTFSIQATNNGPSAATGVTVTDTLPVSVTYGSAASSQRSCTQSAGTVTCSLGNLSNGASASVTITGTPKAAGITTNSASVSANETDSNTANNSAGTSTAVTALTCDGEPLSASTSFDYDENGNQTDRGTDTFTYDHENRLIQVVMGGSTCTSTYNGDGLRMSLKVNDVTTNYTWDAVSGLPVVLQDGTSTYVYGLDLISSTNNSGSQTYFLYDGLGSTTNLTSGSGSVLASYSYDVFGAIRSQTGTSSNQWLFAGEQRDGEPGLYFLRARYYDPATGRFLGQDPLPTGNLYAYVGNNPVNLVDPYGLIGFKDIKKIGTSVSDAAKSVVGGINTTTVLQIADIIPLTPICASGGRALGGAVGTAVAGPGIGTAGGALAGSAIGAVGCSWGSRNASAKRPLWLQPVRF